jgi:sigma-B regulation protein RsbU (phosphoserine phosphatase)
MLCADEQRRPTTEQAVDRSTKSHNALRILSGTSLDEGSTVPDVKVPRVLVADDQSDVVLALRLLLRDAGLDSDAAASVPEIRSRLSATDYDLLLMDLNYARDTTSGREGLELLAEVHSRDPLLPVVVMTGWGSIETAVEAMRRGARGFIHKPWDNAALADAIRREVDDGRATRNAERRSVREQEEAQAIQRALLPAAMPAVAGCDLAARWIPASAFGGDCYDVTPLDGNRVAISIADVCGKGLPAALLMANLQASARAFAASDSSPRTVATRINRELVRNAGLRRFVTFFYGVHDRAAGRLTFVNAGHNPPVLLHADGSVTRLSTGGTVLGAFEESTYEHADVAVAPGDRLVLFTDGITEACGAGDDDFGDDRLVAALREIRTADAATLVDRVFSEVARFTGRPGQFQDDATVLVAAFS